MLEEPICFRRRLRKNLTIKSSICTGEKVAGFKDLKSGKFSEVMLIRDNKDLDVFLEKYDVSVAEITTEW